MNLIRAGRSFLLESSPGEGYHLWFILTDPVEPGGRVVAVMLRTQERYTDATVVLNIGDHPFVKHPSSVDYSSANFFLVPRIKRAIEKGRCNLKEDLSRAVLERIQKGLSASQHTPNSIKAYCRGCF